MQQFRAGTRQQLPPQLFEQMGQYRREVFINRLGWELNTVNGMELDEFDGPDTVYVSSQDDEGKVNGVARLLPTTGPYLMEILKRTAMQLSPAPKSFRVEASDVRVQQWIGGIRGLRVAINNIEGRFKLSQDKHATDVQAAARHFARAVGERSSPERLLEFSGLSHLEAAVS